jgi:hypothetical protein
MKDCATETTTITVHVPMRFTVRGGRKTVISDLVRSRSQSKSDNALAKALARAFRWRQQIESGEYASITELAEANRVNQSYACRLLRLTLLAPSHVTDILNGRQSADLTLKRLSEPFPVEWDQQLNHKFCVRT